MTYTTKLNPEQIEAAMLRARVLRSAAFREIFERTDETEASPAPVPARAPV